MTNTLRSQNQMGNDPYSELERLADLKNKGIVTEEEFQAKKQQLLGLPKEPQPTKTGSDGKSSCSNTQALSQPVSIGIAPDVSADKGTITNIVSGDATAPWGYILFALLAGVVFWITSTNSPENAITSQAPPASPDISSNGGTEDNINTDSSDPLSQMEIAFEGNHTRAEIKTLIDEAMVLHNVERTDENYSRAGSVLIALREKTGQRETAILKYMIRSHVPGLTMDFPGMAALSAAALSAGDQ